MKVLLVDAPNHCLRGEPGSVQVHPLGLGYLAAALAPDHDVAQLVPDIVDFGGRDPWPELLDAMSAAAPDLVGISAVTATFPGVAVLARAVKRRLGPAVKVVVGGVHVSFRPQDARAIAEVDYVVRGEGEDTLCALAAALETGAETGGIPGLTARRPDGGWEVGPPHQAERDLDRLASPRREGILFSEHLHPAFFQALITLRGCPYRCIYCAVPGSMDRKTRYRSAGNVLAEIDGLVARHGVPYLFFHDSVFTLNRPRTLAILDGLIARGGGLPFACQTRADRLDAALLDQMVAAGCHQIFLGIESGDAESLMKIHKDISLETTRAAVGLIKARGIRATGFFMVGFPWETEAHIRKTADFCVSLGLDAVSLFSATPLPGTELWEMSAGVELPETIDFRRPQLNLTTLARERYVAVYGEVSERIADYNAAQTRAMLHWPRG